METHRVWLGFCLKPATLTTTHLSNHHKVGTSVGPGQYPRHTDARRGRSWVAQMHHKRLQAANKRHTLARRRSTLVNHLHGSGARSLKPQIYDATIELDDKIRLRVFFRSRNVQEPTGSPTGSLAGDPERDSAGELQDAPRQHVQSDHLHQKQTSGR